MFSFSFLFLSKMDTPFFFLLFLPSDCTAFDWLVCGYMAWVWDTVLIFGHLTMDFCPAISIGYYAVYT